MKLKDDIGEKNPAYPDKKKLEVTGMIVLK